MRSIRIALVAALAVLAPVLVGTPARAGGPTSVLLVVPGESRTAALYYDDAEYDRLGRLLGADDPGPGATEPPPGTDDEGPAGSSAVGDPGVTITWLMHDVTVYRVDRVYLSGSGGGWVATTKVVDGVADLLSEPPAWRRLPDPKALGALLDELGVGPSGGGRSVVAATAAAAGPTAVVPAVGAPAPAEPSVWTGWWWAPVGLVLGALGVLVPPALRRRRAAVPDPGDEEPERWDAELGEPDRSVPVRET